MYSGKRRVHGTGDDARLSRYIAVPIMVPDRCLPS